MMNDLLRFRPAPFPELDPEFAAAPAGSGMADAFAEVGETGSWDNELGEWDDEAPDTWAEVAGELPFADPAADEIARRRLVRGSPSPRRTGSKLQRPSPRAASTPQRRPAIRRPLPTAGARPRPLPMRPLRRLPRLPMLPLRPVVGVRPILAVLPIAPTPSATKQPDEPLAHGATSGDAAASASPEATPSEHVRWVQDCLNRALGLVLPVDGVLAAPTRSAVRTFQERQGLAVSGLIGPDTEAALRVACAPGPTDPPATPSADTPDTELTARPRHGVDCTCPTCTRRKPMRPAPAFAAVPFTPTGTEPAAELLTSPPRAGETPTNASQAQVRWIQSTLNRVLSLRLAVDGVLGSQTRAAIRTFQQRQGLPVDGIVGRRTEAALRAAGAPPPSGTGSTPAGPACRPLSASAVDCRQPSASPRPPTGSGAIQVYPATDPDLRDRLLYNFDINDHRLKPEHRRELTALLRFMVADHRARLTGNWVVSIAGMASRSGTRTFNDALSGRRAACVERFLRDELARVAPSLAPRVVFDTCFQGFQGAPTGENALYRAVRIAIHRPGRRPPPVPIPVPPARPACAFAPSAHGFRFFNRFTLPTALTRALTSPPLGPILTRLGVSVGSGAYGLCGGMSTLALDHFRYRVPIPTPTTEPAIGSPLYNRLLSRQLDSLNLNLASVGPELGAPVLKFADWMGRPDRGSGGVAALTAAEFVRVRASLARGDELILGLVLTSRASGGALTDNHQVLARCLYQVAPDRWEVMIYDPNFPGCNTAKLEVRLIGREALTRRLVTCPGAATRTTAVRGFFIMPYRATRP
ncbi:peptidoglycan-binding protein [Thiocapsa rosea]|uniref:OmpA family protein n=1 Tax=Thiocapsa rosea TaxID=69360 RepID=A0A495V8C6_9GAMM|nr:peptidoglycan-binding protein [Thiocapsa rosea]RKT44863.1 OmpA family protein [Thiocapsa rosea]